MKRHLRFDDELRKEVEELVEIAKDVKAQVKFMHQLVDQLERPEVPNHLRYKQ